MGEGKVEESDYPFKKVDGTYYVDSALRISHLELMVGGEIPTSSYEKDDLIRRLRLFISRLNVNLEKSEDTNKLLKRKYQKQAEEVKESEGLIRQLTGRITEQANMTVAVEEQMK